MKDTPVEDFRDEKWKGKFGKWKIVAYAGKSRTVSGNGLRVQVTDQWQCLCACGAIRIIPRHNLLRGMSTQCMGCARKGNRQPESVKQATYLRNKLKQRWRLNVIRDCVSEWRDFAVFQAWAEPQDWMDMHFRKHDHGLPHGPENTWFSDVLQSTQDMYDRCVAIFVKEGMAYEAAVERLNSISRQRVRQVLWKDDGLCTICGKPRVTSAYCEKHRNQQTVHARIQLGWSEEEAASVPVARKVRRPEGQCKRCELPAVKRGLCLVHMEEANEENRIKTRMRKSGWTRDQVLAWPKGRHFKGETLVSQDR